MTLNWPTTAGILQQTHTFFPLRVVAALVLQRLRIDERHASLSCGAQTCYITSCSAIAVFFYVGIKSRIKILDMSSSLKIVCIPPQFCMFDLFHNLKSGMTHQKRAKLKQQQKKSTYKTNPEPHLLSSSSTEATGVNHAVCLITTTQILLEFGQMRTSTRSSHWLPWRYLLPQSKTARGRSAVHLTGCSMGNW